MNESVSHAVCVYNIYSLKRTREATCFSKQKFALYAQDLLFSILNIFFFFSILGYVVESISLLIPGIQKKTQTGWQV